MVIQPLSYTTKSQIIGNEKLRSHMITRLEYIDLVGQNRFELVPTGLDRSYGTFV